MIRDIQEIQSLATKYSKQQLAQMAQMGMLDPTKAVMAGMMIKRIEEQNQKPPQTTVAQDVLSTPQQMPMQGQPQQPQQQPQQPQQMAQAPAGIEGLPAGEVGNYAGGGIVAFGEGGLNDNEYYGLPIGGSGRSGSEGYWNRPVMPYNEQMRNVGSSIINGLRRIISDPAMSEKDRAEAKAKLNALSTTAPAVDQSAAETARLQRQNDRNPFATDNNVPPPPRRDAPPPTLTTSKPIEPPTLGDFNPNAIPLTGADRPPATKIEELAALKKKREAQEDAEGYNRNLTSDQLRRIEGKQSELDTNKERAGGEALMNFGLGLLGAKRGQEWETAGKSGQAALNAYKSDVKDYRAAKDKLDERAESLRLAENQAKKTNSAADIAKQDAQQAKFDAQQLEFYKADSELKKTGALISSYTRGQDAQLASSTYHTQVGEKTAREGHDIELYRAKLSHSASMYNSNVIKQQGLDNARTKMLIDASDSFIKSYAANATYMNNPQLLQQDAMAYAEKMAAKFMPNAPGARPPADVSAPANGNLPPLNSDRYRPRS